MRVVFLNPTGVLGGGERSLLDLIVSLRRHDPSIQMHLIACDDGPLLEAARSAGASAEVLAMPQALAGAGDSGPGGRWLETMRQLLRAGLAARPFVRRLDAAIAAARADVVHSNGIKTHLMTSLSRLDFPIVWHLRDFVGERPIVGNMLRRAARQKARNISIITVSNAVAADARTCLGRSAPTVPIDVVHNAIDTDHFSPGDGDAAWLDQLAGFPHDSSTLIRIGLVATYARWKGHEALFEAARLLRRRAIDRAIRFYIVGGAIYRTTGSQFSEEELREQARRFDVGECVGFVPFQADPAPVYRALDIAVHTSTRPEPFGRTIVEAMACGKAVIASSAGGAAELIRDGVDALAVRPADAPALAEAIARLVGDADLRRRLGRAARSAAAQRFSRPRLGPEVIKTYHRLYAGGDW